MWKPVFLDYSYNFAVRNFRHGAFGNLTKIDNTQQVKNSESFFSVVAVSLKKHRGVFLLRANGGHINYRYDSDVLFADDTDHSRFSFFGLRAGVARNTLDKFLYPRRGSELHLSAIYVAGRDKYQPYDAKDFVSRETRQWFGGRFSWDKFFDVPGVSWFSFGLNVDAVWTNHPRFRTESATLMSMPDYAPVPHARMVRFGSALKCRIQRQAAPEKAANRAIRMKGFAGRGRAGRFGEEEKRGLPLSGTSSSPVPLQTSKAYLPSRAKQRLQGLYPLLRASSADLKRTVQAVQLK